MINYEKVGEKIFSIVKGHNHNLVMFNEEGMETNDASEARRFFVNKPNYMITLDAENRKIKFNKNRHVTLEEIESVMKQIKNLATTNMLKNEVQVFGKEITPKDFAYQATQFKEANMNDISEASLSRMSGVKKTSYQTLESVKMVVRHRKEVDEDVRGSRSRQISAIFLEQAGERFRFPHNHLAGARAMARHMYEGGNMQDALGEYIIESVSNVIKLSEFVRYARSNKLMNEANEDVVKTVKENINTIRTEIKGLTGAKSYAKMSETILAREANVLEEDDTTDLQDMFTVRKFDEKITDTLPLIKRLMDNKQTWRDAILEASQVEIAISEKTELSEDDMFEFENPVQQMGYKVRGIAERMIGESDLSVFVGKVAGKLIEGAGISDFEKKVVGNVLENARIREEECVCEGCGEVTEACKCTPSDVIDIISDSFELKMKMLEHEDIFNEDEDQCSECDGVGEVWGKACEKCGGEEALEESEGEKCIRCRKGTMQYGDTMMGPAKECDRCNYQQQVNEDDWDDEVRRGEAASGATGMGYPDDTVGMDVERPDCDDCDGTGIGLDDVSDCYTCNGTGKVEDDYDDFDGQPSEYDEWQDYMGGDDWDQGQFDESLNELRKAAGLPIVEGLADADEDVLQKVECPECGDWSMEFQGQRGDHFDYECNTCGEEKTEYLPKTDAQYCPDCQGTGMASDTIFDDPCSTCGGEGAV